MPHTVTGLYPDVDAARAAMRDLVAAGFDRNRVSMLVNLVARENDPLKQSKSRYWRRGNVDAPMGVLLGLIVGIVAGAAIGAVVSVLPLTYSLATLAGWGAAIGGAAGAVCGGILNSSVPRILGQNLATVEKSGATLVRVLVDDDDRLDEAREILRRHHPVEMEGRLERWDEKGWEAYDPGAEPVR